MFVEYLWGIETGLVIAGHHVSPGFVEYLWGIETQI